MIDGLAPASCAVECAGQRHHLVWRDGALAAFDHPEPERERALTALGGERYRCLDLLEVWEQHRDDLDVLVLGSRGPHDALAARDGAASAARPGLQGRTVSYGGSYRPLSSLRWHAHDDEQRPRGPGLADVLRLGGGLPDRLVAEVVDAWTARVAAGEVGDAAPRLHAALYGRFAGVVRGWSGDRALRVDLEMGPHGSAAAVERDGDAVRGRLPFSWLADVWVPGQAVVADRLVLSARRVGRRLELGTLDRALHRRATVTIEVHED